ncbi:cold-shock protein [Chloroflexota bacterium]
MPKGAIIRLIADRGFGFIKGEEKGDLFFHRSELQGVDYSSLREGQEVEYEGVKGRDGRPQAVRVRLVETQVDDDSGDVGDGGEDGGEDDD